MDSSPKNTHPESLNNSKQNGSEQQKADDDPRQKLRPSLLDSLKIESARSKKLRILKAKD
jgi:hypothetical protein